MLNASTRAGVRALAGFGLAVVFWWSFSAPYAAIIAMLSEPLVRAMERPAVTRLVASDSEVTIERSDFDRSSDRPALRMMDLTTNVIVVITLFAAAAAPWRDRNVRGLLAALAGLVPVHVAATVANVESIYALRLGPWSAAHYGVFARNFWGTAAHFYTIIGSYGMAFALWWIFRPASQDEGKTVSTRRSPRITRTRAG